MFAEAHACIEVHRRVLVLPCLISCRNSCYMITRNVTLTTSTREPTTRVWIIAQFVLKIEKLCADPKTYDLRPRLWLLIRIYSEHSLSIKKAIEAIAVTREASRNMPLDAIMINRCQGDDTFVAFQPMRFLRFCRNGEVTFLQRCLQSLYFSWSPPSTQSRLPSCAGVQLSRDYISAFNDRIKIPENREL